MRTFSNLFNTYIIGSGVINTLLFNYNINNVDIIRNNKKTKLLITERITYSLVALSTGWLRLGRFIDYINIKVLKENLNDYDLVEFPKKEIKYNDILRHI